MNYTTLARIIKLGMLNFYRHRWLTLGATLLMTLTLIMISVFLIITMVISSMAEVVRDRVDFAIYFDDDSISDDKIIALKNEIIQIPEVDSEKTEYIDKAKTLEIFKRLPLDDRFKEPLSSDYNPLPRSIMVKVNNPDTDKMKAVINTIVRIDREKIVSEDMVSYYKNQQNIESTLTIARFTQSSGLILSLLFVIIAMLNVYNIIRISIRARMDEIEIMRFVGASSGFVQGPFIVEGALFGILATLFSTLFVWLITLLAAPYFDNIFSSLSIDLVNLFFSKLWIIILVQLVVGVLIGVLVSLVSIRKYLRI